MVEVPEAREFSASTITTMVQAVDSDWELIEAEPNDRGFCSVYRVVVDDAGTPRELYLKASPDEDPWSVPTEARLQAVLGAETSIPVPEIYGVVDDADDLPTPYYVMESLDGAAVEYERVAYFPDAVLRRLARQIGRYLGELHSIPGLEHFGPIRHDDEPRSGSRPSDDPSTLSVGDPRERWADYLRDYTDAELDRHADSDFAALTPTLREWFDDRTDDLDGPLHPVLGRNDHGLHNLLVDPDTGEITAMIDWGYTLAVPASFDFEFAVYIYSGAYLAGLPGVSDRRDLVREAMLAGYRETAPGLVDRVNPPRPLYTMLVLVRMMNDFGNLDVPVEHETAARDRVRTHVRAILEE